MDTLKYLVDLHKSASRQGPGSDRETLRALELARLDPSARLRVADIGCGTGASTLQLARSLNASITAVDFLPEFIEILGRRARDEGLSEKITPLVASMEMLPFREREYDVLWSEGAVYNMGFERGISEWRPFLRPGGILVVSEITWTTGSRPREIHDYWVNEYPEIDTASSKIRTLEQYGYSPVGSFILPRSCWLENYYRPLQDGFEAFLSRHDHSEESLAIVEAERKEIAMYEKYGAYYSYGVYIAKKSA